MSRIRELSWCERVTPMTPDAEEPSHAILNWEVTALPFPDASLCDEAGFRRQLVVRFSVQSIDSIQASKVERNQLENVEEIQTLVAVITGCHAEFDSKAIGIEFPFRASRTCLISLGSTRSDSNARTPKARN